MNRLIDLPPKSVEYMLSDDIVLIDVRREDEWSFTGIIPNSHLMTFFDEYGNHDAVNWIKKLQSIVKSKDQIIVLICAHANRTRLIGNYLIQEHQYTNVTHLAGGIEQYINEHRVIEDYEK